MTQIQRQDPVGHVVVWAVSVMAISFAVGFVGPILLSNANLGPMLGIFVTGPLGMLAGTSVGAMRVASYAPRVAFAAIISVWAATLLYTLFMIGIVAQGAIPAIPLQALVIVATAFLVSRGSPQSRLGLVALAVQVIILATTLFPPVVKPWWVPAAQQSSAPVPSFAFILDGRFAAGTHFPLFAINRADLVIVWMVVIALGIGLGLLVRRR